MAQPRHRRATAATRGFGLALVALLSVAQTTLAPKSRVVDAITAALRARDFAEAAERSASALRQNPNDPQLWTLNGMSLASMGKRAEALQSFQRARGGGRLARD
jgi:Flp pilus assembly protein TadD